MAQSTCRGREEAHELVTYECCGLLRRPLIAVHAQHVKTGLDQSFGSLPTEMNFGMTAAGRELEAVVRATRGQPLRYGFRVSFQDYREVGTVSLGIKMPQEGWIYTVKPLHDKTGGNIPIADDVAIHP